MNYTQTLDYLYNSLPVFQKIGSSAYKEGLENSHAIDQRLNHPHQKYKTIHVAGTNGKGSTSHLLAAILQKSGYKTGLYTSPHLVDFRERIKINGKMISEDYVVSFVDKHIDFFDQIHPSFFEVTTAMAFDYFAHEEVDVAVIEVGLGGRLDCTNIITPDVSIITNISFDHIALLGNTLSAIAAEKAGIIKPNIPVVIGETLPETKNVFLQKAHSEKAPVVLVEEENPILSAELSDTGKWIFATKDYPNLIGELGGLVQEKNAATVLCAIRILKEKGYKISDSAVYEGFAKVVEITGLQGRWQCIGTNPKIILDTGHNVDGIKFLVKQLEKEKQNRLNIVIGIVEDKDVDSILKLLPKDAIYYFTKASIPRALNETILADKALCFGLKGKSYSTVGQAIDAAREIAGVKDVIFIGGSTFVVADALLTLKV
ncbi:MAG: bifunctional folylpolyglutamate synthase/dihydrofolate synthase [Dysgonamonadaceae bacterium]|jgi:dihydrofolate synthase/folylpolyglutamate synthase|nr:bifunctional folylpolyglutamate synthase/dihydrofolate synthase [Dysgonamonadaceae bacterium]